MPGRPNARQLELEATSRSARSGSEPPLQLSRIRIRTGRSPRDQIESSADLEHTTCSCNSRVSMEHMSAATDSIASVSEVDSSRPSQSSGRAPRSRRAILRLMEELTEHVIAEMMQIHYDHEQHAADERAGEARMVEWRRAVLLAGSDSPPPPPRRRRLSRGKQQVVIQYQPATRNAHFTSDGDLTFNPAAAHALESTSSVRASSQPTPSAHAAGVGQPIATPPRRTQSADSYTHIASQHEHSYAGDTTASELVSAPVRLMSHPAATVTPLFLGPTETRSRVDPLKHEHGVEAAPSPSISQSASNASVASNDGASASSALLPSRHWLAASSSAASSAARRRKRQRNDDARGATSDGTQEVDESSSESHSGSQSCSQQASLSQSASQDQADSTAADPADTHPVHHRKLKYPSQSCEKRFAGLMTSLADCYLAIQECTSLNKRSLHYKDKHLFPRQRDSDTSIDLLCNILQVRTDEINIIASAKGQVMGALWYDVAYFDGDEVKDEQKERKVDKADCSAGAVITPFTHHITGMTCDVDWVLLVEKDTIWSKIAQSGFPQLQRCLLITDRGMPSKSTRRFLKLFHSSFPAIPIFGLFDADPSGIDIYRVCKYGADRSVHEDLALPCMQLLGVCIRDVDHLGLLSMPSVGLPLTERDRKKIDRMTLSEVGCNDPVIRVECENMRRLDRKAEIESLDQLGPEYLTEVYLTNKLAEATTQAPNANSHVEETIESQHHDSTADDRTSEVTTGATLALHSSIAHESPPPREMYTAPLPPAVTPRPAKASRSCSRPASQMIHADLGVHAAIAGHDGVEPDEDAWF